MSERRRRLLERNVVCLLALTFAWFAVAVAARVPRKVGVVTGLVLIAFCLLATWLRSREG
ncbi:MAG: hypothetical protein H5T97_04800 [Firmicutes bacterium]|nr:hypothetical protein [Bacillota bacterium]